MLTSKERKVLIRRSKALRDERDSIDNIISTYEQDKRDLIAELETMLHLLERDMVAQADSADEESSDDATYDEESSDDATYDDAT